MSLVILSGCEKGKDLPPAEKLALFRAVEAGDVEILKKALDSGVSPNLRLADNQYLIFDATVFDNRRALRMLIEAGANVDAKSEEGSGPLIVAMLGGQCEDAKMLLQAGANSNEILPAKNAGASALEAEYFDKSALELYLMFKKTSFQAPINIWEKDKACWLEVERLMGVTGSGGHGLK